MRLLILLLTFTSCATIFKGGSQPVKFEVSPKNEEATLKLYNKNGKIIAEEKGSLTRKLKTGAGFFKGEKYTLDIEAEGYHPKRVEYDTSVRVGLYGFGNLFFGGLLGWFIVDPASGAMFALDAESKESLILEKIEKDKKGKVVIKPKKKLNILVDHSAASVDLYIFNRGRIRINDEVSKSFKFGKEESLEFNSNVNNYTLKFDYFGLDTDGCFKVNDDVEEVSFYFTLPFFRFSDPEIEIKNTKTGETIPHGCLSK